MQQTETFSPQTGNWRHEGMVMRIWKDLPAHLQEDLSKWYNVRDLDTDDRLRLLRLWKAGQFEAWNCPKCGDRIYNGTPDSWSHFQGANQVDYCSYPGSS